MPLPDIDPIAFSLGPLAVRWYALGYIVGIGLAWAYGRRLVGQRSLWRDSTPPFTPPQWLDFLFWAVVGIVGGGRLGYVIFYNPGYFAAHPAEIVMTWQGGMSFHGGLIGVCLVVWLFSRRNGAPVLSALDLLGATAPIGLLFGRLGNFINGELYGRATTLPWGVVFPGGGPEPRHPSQLYEAALEGLALFVILRFATHMRLTLRRPGLTAGLFGIGYAVARILVEAVRDPDAHIGYLYGGWLTMGMVYSLPVLAFGLWLLSASRRKKPRRE
ncbi:MAG TPA: prolipoprotein diacylglyceryl transferase [Devosiaceae bacterium]|nr:prolipoprotein diacylglyceryl transferase [Devosiaceae bacterium]